MTRSIWPDGEQTQELLTSAKDGDAEAVDRLLDRHRESLRRMVGMRLDQKIKRRIDVSDVVQDVLVEANRRLQDYLANPVMAFHLWIRQIAKDRIIDSVLSEYLTRPGASLTDIDGIRLDFPDWWFNLRKSNTEPYLRLVVEASSAQALSEHTSDLKGRFRDLDPAIREE